MTQALYAHMNNKRKKTKNKMAVRVSPPFKIQSLAGMG
jgi:hypothetical protein